MIDKKVIKLGSGTLFIAQEPGFDNHEQLLHGIKQQRFDKPWGILLKDQGLVENDFTWWSDQGFHTHCAGNHKNKNFYQDLINILTKYNEVATPQFTSAAFFAASISMRVRVVENVLTTTNYPLEYGQKSSVHDIEDKDGNIKEVWIKLTSEDIKISRSVALHHLGIDFMGSREELKERYLQAVQAIKRPIHLYPVKSTFVYKLLLVLIKNNVPVQKFYPFPIKKIMNKILGQLGFHFILNIKTSEFHNYNIITPKKIYSEKYYWFFNPLINQLTIGNRFFPRLVLRKIRELFFKKMVK